ncbi:Maltose acetyltransferase [Lacticaseibacillus paracasei]|nr:Maltose acetyltransferase [Lacticaseibacillus paracasei]
MNLEEKFAFMATGKPYDDMDPLLLAVRDEATAKTDALNNEHDPAKRNALFRKLVGQTGVKPFVNPNFHCEFGRNYPRRQSFLCQL